MRVCGRELVGQGDNAMHLWPRSDWSCSVALFSAWCDVWGSGCCRSGTTETAVVPTQLGGSDTDVRKEDDAAQAFMDLEVGIVGLVEAFEERWGEGGA